MTRPAVLLLAFLLCACDSITGNEESGNSRENPAGVGQAVELATSGPFSGPGRARITLIRTVSGAAAWDSIRRANQFNDPAPSGREYVLARFRVEILQKTGGAFRMADVEWESVTGGGTVLPQPLFEVCCMEPELDGEGFQGATWEGWLALFAVPGDGLLAVYQRENGGAWFRLR